MADTVVVIDGNSLKALSDLGYKNVTYVPNPISDTFQKEVERQKSQIERCSKMALFVGHVVPTKGVMELVEGCRQVPGLSLRVVGKCTDEMREKLCSIATGRDNGDWLTLVGEIPHAEVIGEMLRADSFIFPSYTEAFPNVILEAMACGCAIASSNVGAIPEMLDFEGEQVGLCFTPQSADEVAKAVKAIYEDDAFRERLSQKAKEKVTSTYAIDKVWQALTATWESVNS